MIVIDKEQVIERLKELLIEIGELDVQPEMINTHTSNIALEYSLNSILIMEYLLRIEEVFDIEIGDDDLNSRLLNNFEDLSTYIMKKL